MNHPAALIRVTRQQISADQLTDHTVMYFMKMIKSVTS